jgi:hypothetical protein
MPRVMIGSRGGGPGTADLHLILSAADLHLIGHAGSSVLVEEETGVERP